MFVYTENCGSAAHFNTTQRSGGRLHTEGILGGWDTVSTVPNTMWKMHT